MTRTIMTVRGPVPAAEFGFTLPHEHVLIDLVRIFPANMLAFDFQLLDEELAIEEIGAFARSAASFADGLPALVDLTTDERVGRSPEALVRISEALDLHIVMATGRYREPWFEPDFGRRSTWDLARHFIDEIETGVGETGIRAGIIGELGADRDFVSPAEERVLRAGAKAQEASGLTITLHARASRVALEQLRILADAGADPTRVIVGHCDTIPEPDYHEELARTGAWVEFDTIRGKVPRVVERRLDFVKEARRRGYLERLLLSQDNCALSHLTTHGNTGYDYLATGFLERLRAEGFSEDELQRLFVENPVSALSPSG